MSLVGVIIGELLVWKSGLGYLIMYESQVFNINLVITSVVILGVISYLMYFVIDKFEQKIKRWFLVILRLIWNLKIKETV